MTKEIDFAILAPVPEEHLRSGIQLLGELKSAKKPEFVAYATDSAEVLKLLQKIDVERRGKPVPMWIYASHNGLPDNDTYNVSWFGWYVGHEELGSGQCLDDPTHRPSTTDKDNLNHCKAFWHISKLRKLQPDERKGIKETMKYKGGQRKNAPPRRPAKIQPLNILDNDA